VGRGGTGVEGRLRAALADAVVPPPSSEATAIKLQLLRTQWAAELSIESNLSEGSGVSLALEPPIDLSFNPGDSPGASSRPPLYVVLTLHSIHFIETLKCFASQPFTVVKGSEAGFPLLFKAVKGVKGSEREIPFMVDIAAKRP
jgi:hypothetical protein